MDRYRSIRFVTAPSFSVTSAPRNPRRSSHSVVRRLARSNCQPPDVHARHRFRSCRRSTTKLAPSSHVFPLSHPGPWRGRAQRVKTGPASMVFAATRPERTRALILHGATVYSGDNGWDDVERDPAELRARLLPELGEEYTPSTEQLARLQEYGRAVRSAWGSGAALS